MNSIHVNLKDSFGLFVRLMGSLHFPSDKLDLATQVSTDYNETRFE